MRSDGSKSATPFHVTHRPEVDYKRLGKELEIALWAAWLSVLDMGINDKEIRHNMLLGESDTVKWLPPGKVIQRRIEDLEIRARVPLHESLDYSMDGAHSSAWGKLKRWGSTYRPDKVFRLP